MPLAALRRAEDAFVDELFAAAPALGMPFLAARFPRSYVDANREPYELDPGMFEGPLPRPLNHRTTRVAAGLGMIPRVAASGEAIYRGRVPSGEIEQRLESLLAALSYGPVDADRADPPACSAALLLVDAHSMPSSASGMGLRERDHRVDIVLGDNHGESCAADLVDCAERWLSGRGLGSSATSPMPAASPRSATDRPSLGRHALQIEINRALYMDEARHEKLPTAGARRAADGRIAGGDRRSRESDAAAPAAGGRIDRYPHRL